MSEPVNNMYKVAEDGSCYCGTGALPFWKYVKEKKKNGLRGCADNEISQWAQNLCCAGEVEWLKGLMQL